MWIPPLDYPCQVCQRIDNVDQMLLCDNYNGGYHLFCLKLELTQVPADIWYCSSCFLVAPWFLFKPCHAFLGLGLGGDTWNFHLSLLLCVVYICAWLVSFYFWLVLVFLFNRVYYGFTPLRHHTSWHYMSWQCDEVFKCVILGLTNFRDSWVTNWNWKIFFNCGTFH